MNTFSRGIRNAFRNAIRTGSIVVILGLSIGLALTMLLARQAVSQKINTVKSSIGNTITIQPAGVSGFQGGGNPLTQSQIDSVKLLANVSSVDESINDRLTKTSTNLVSSIDAGSLGRRFNSNNSYTPPADGGFGGFGGGTFTPPVSALGSTSPGNLNGMTLKLTSGSQIDGSKDIDVALIGKDLATKNNLSVGSNFSAYNSTIKVAGIFDTGTSFANNQVIFSLPTLQRLSAQTSDITNATVTVNSISNMESVTAAIKSQFGNAADITSSKDRADTAIQPLESVQNISLYSLIGAVIAGAVIILLTMVMIVRERRREIGVLKAIGASNMKVISQFMVEAVTLTILGALIGLVIGVVGGNPVTKLLVNNSTSNSATVSTGASAQGGTGGFARRIGGGIGGGAGGFTRRLGNFGPVSSIRNIHAVVGWNILLDGLVAAILIALVGSTIAAGLIAKVRPAEVMRVE